MSPFRERMAFEYFSEEDEDYVVFEPEESEEKMDELLKQFRDLYAYNKALRERIKQLEEIISELEKHQDS